MKKRKELAVLFTVCLLLGGCAGTGQRDASEKEESAVVSFSCVANPEADQEIYVILKSYHGDYWAKVIEGICDAAKEIDKAVYLGGIDNEKDLEGQKALMEQALDNGADAILLAPVDSTYLVDNCVYARGKGIPVILIDSALNTSDYDTCFMTDNMEAGKMAAQEMMELLEAENHTAEETLSVAIQLSSDASQAMVNRVSGFLEYWSAYAPENWEIIDDILLNGGNIETAQKNTEELLEKHEDIKGLFGCNNTSTIGIASTIYKNSRKDLVMVGFDLADETKELIQNPEYAAASIMQNQDQMGYRGILALDALLKGETVEQKYFDTGVRIVDSAYLAQKGVL